MPRQTSTGVSQVVLKTNDGNAPNLGVFQSLNVQAAAPKSAQLAAGLAEVLGTAMPFMERHIENKAEQAANKGIADELLGRADIKDYDRSTAYRQGVDSIRTKKIIFAARAEWQEYYANEVDKTLPADEVARIYDGFMLERLKDVATTNPKMAAKMAPEYMHGMQELVVRHQAQLSEQHMAEAEAVMQQEVVDAVGRGDTLRFFELVEDQYRLSGDKAGAYTAGIRAVGQQALATGNPELLDAIPMGLQNEDGTQTVNPDFNAEQRQMVEQFREGAKAKRLELQQIARGHSKMDVEWRWQDMHGRGEIIPDDEIRDQWIEDGLFTEAELTGWRARNAALREAREDILLFDGFDPTKPLYEHIGTLDPNGKEYTKERVQAQVNRLVEGHFTALQDRLGDEVPREQLLAMAARQVTDTQSLPYEPLKSVFTHVPVTDPQRFANAANAFAELPVTHRNAYVPDERRRAQFEEFLRRRDAEGGKPGADQRAVEAMAAVDVDVVQENLKQNRQALNQSREKIKSMEAHDKSWSPFDIAIADLADKEYATRVIHASTEIRVGEGAPVDAAREAALKDFIGGHLFVPANGKYRAIPRIPGVTDRVGEGIQWVEQSLPEIGRQKGYEIPEGAYLQLDYLSRSNAVFRVVDADGVPIASGLRFPAQSIEREFTKWAANGGDYDHSKTTEESRREQRRREWERRTLMDKAAGRIHEPKY